MKPITHLFVAGLLLLAHMASAQTITTTFTPAAVTQPVGTTVALQFKVTNFTNIWGAQFPILFNKAVLKFDSISLSVLPGFSTGNYTPPQFANNNGRVIVSWQVDQDPVSGYPNGYSVADGTAIFTVYFKLLANGVSTVNIASGVWGNIEVTRAGGVLAQVNYQTGGSTITVGSGNPPPPAITGFHIIANTIYIPQNTTACMPVTVNDFDNMLSLLYVMHWNTAVLQLPASNYVQALNLAGLTTGSFNASNPGNLVTVWDDPQSSGVTKADGTKIYEVCFKAIGAVGTNSLITFDGIGLPASSGTNAEAYNASSQQLWVNGTGITDTIFVVTAPPAVNPVTFSADLDTVPQGQQVCVDVKATNFTNVGSAQYGMTYDATKLQYQSLQFGANPLQLATGNFNAGTPGEIRFIWDDPTANPNGVTVPANTMLYSVCFMAAGPVNSQSPFAFAALNGLPVEVIKQPGNQVVTPSFSNGSVYIKAAQTITAVTTTTPVSCNGGTNGTITLSTTGCSGATYVWSNGTTTKDLANVGAGTYTVTVTCSGGSTATASATVSQPLPVTAQANVTNIACPGGANGAITLVPSGGTSPYAYNWNPGASGGALTGLGAGTYMYTITDNKGCVFTPASGITLSAPQNFFMQQTVQTVSCNGGNNGGINATFLGGTAPYTYAWSNGATTEDLTGLGVGVYVPTLTDANGCSQIFGAIQVTAPPALNVSLVNTSNITCFGNQNGSATISVSGGSSTTYTYSWSNGSVAPNPGVFTPGNYSVTVSDISNCTQVLNGVIISGPAAPLAVAPPQITNVQCPGTNSGVISLSVSGGWGNSLVAWSNGLPAGANQNGVAAGTYTATVTDAGGCTVAVPATVSQPPVITYGSPTVTNVSCGGAANGSISIFPAGGNGGAYTVNWGGTLSGTTISTLTGGAYTPVITDGQGCTSVLPAITVSEPPVINVAETVSSTAISLNVSGGVGPYTFNWTGPNGFTSNNEDLTGLTQQGNYTVTVTDNTGCSVVELYEPSNALVATTVLSVEGSCGNNGCILLSIPANATSPYVITWPGGTLTTDQTLVSVCSLAPGTYVLTVADNGGNSIALPAQTIVQKEGALASSNYVNPFNDLSSGSITMTQNPGIAGPLTYAWSTGANGPSIDGLNAGTYTVTVTNQGSGCTATQTFNLTQSYLPHAGMFAGTVQPNCASASNGSVNFQMNGGNGPTYQFQWSGPNGYTSSQEDLAGLAEGVYSLTVTDESSVTSIYSVTITAQSHLAITNVNELSVYGPYQVSGADECDGIANVAFTGQAGGNVSILWSNNATTAQTNNLCGGAYSVTVTDAAGCSSVWSDALTAPSAIATVTSVVKPVSCHDECDAEAQIVINGGQAPYSVEWSTGQSDQLASPNSISNHVDLCSGTYQVTVTDNLGVSRIETLIVADPGALIVQFSNIEPTSFNTCDGEVLAQVVGGSGTFTYVWSSSLNNSGNGQRAEQLCPGEVVTFIVTNGNGCSVVATDSVPFPEDGCMKVRPVITPNDDNLNDYTEISCIDQTPINHVDIFNRYGQLVFETDNYANNPNDPAVCWTGKTKNGLPLPEGVYYYVLTFTNDQGNEEQLKGHINLLR